MEASGREARATAEAVSALAGLRSGSTDVAQTARRLGEAGAELARQASARLRADEALEAQSGTAIDGGRAALRRLAPAQREARAHVGNVHRDATALAAQSEAQLAAASELVAVPHGLLVEAPRPEPLAAV